MRKLKITQGTTKVDCGIDLIGENDELMQIIVFSETENTHNLAHVFAFNQERLEANAQLIADAFNTSNKCDMLPSELLEQRNELLEMLQKIFEDRQNETQIIHKWNIKKLIDKIDSNE